LKRGQETKVAVAAPYNSSSGNLNSYVYFSQDITGTAETYALIPPVAQGTDDHQRIGDQISPTSLTVKGNISLSRELTFSTQLIADIYFLTSKQVKSETVYGGVPITSMFIDAGGGLASYDGTVRNSQLPLNQDDFTLIKHKRFKFEKPSGSLNNAAFSNVGAQSLGIGCYDWTVKVPLPKTLKYATAANTVPQNAYPFMVIGYHFADDNGMTVQTGTRLVSCTAQSTLYYKDA